MPVRGSLLDAAQEIGPGVVADRRDFHRHPELAYQETRTSALIAARHVTGRNVVVCSEHAHSSVEKDARMLGMELRKVAVDDELRMRTDEPLADVAVVVATVGTTSFASSTTSTRLSITPRSASNTKTASAAASCWPCSLRTAAKI